MSRASLARTRGLASPSLVAGLAALLAFWCVPGAARAEIRRQDTRLIGSVGYFPEKYGDGLTRLALDILMKKPVPPAVFVKHTLVTSRNVGRFYPNDALMRYPL